MTRRDISEEGRRQRFAQWEATGLDRIKADLLNGGYWVVGGPPEVRALAWEWVRLKEAEAAKSAAGSAELLLLKSNVHGVGVDLKEVWRRACRIFGRR